MSGLLANPKVLIAVIAGGIIFLVSVYGGALGNQFGGGFLGSPLANIELKAEPVSANPIIGGYVITNTMVTTWIAIFLLGLLSYLGTRRIKEVPGRLQGFLEVILEFFIGITESVAGPEKARRFFPLVVTIFLFIVMSNWLGILPGFGTIGRFEPAEEIIHHKEAAAEKAGDELDLGKIKLQIFDVGGSIAVIDSAAATASALASLLEVHELGTPATAQGRHRMLTTGDVDRFRDTAVRLFGPAFAAVEELAPRASTDAVAAGR